MLQTMRKPLYTAAVVLGLGLGSYGIASAASGSSGDSGSTTPIRFAGRAHAGDAQAPWGHQRADETPLTGDALSQVRAAAIARVGSGASVIRVETDADGHAAYEAHMRKADGTPVTVYVDKSYDVVGVESR